MLGLLPWLAQAASVLPAAEPAPQWRDCWLPGIEHQARCGVLRRPLDPAAPQGPQIELHVAVLPAQARRPLPDPVVFFAGGPGQSAIGLAAQISALLAHQRHRRDLILIDQRGTGRSAPLRCEADGRPPESLAAMLSSTAQQRAMQRCLTQLLTLPHGDLRHYTTPVAVQDAEAVRRALGVERWNLVGLSYGTRVALEYLRQFPERVRRVVLDGVAPPDMALPLSAEPDAQAALDALLQDCETQPACQQQFPGLRAQWRGLLAGLPREVVVEHPLTGRSERLTLSREMLGTLVRAPLYAPPLAAGLPQAIQAAAAGRFTPLLGLASALGGGAGDETAGTASGMHFSVICSEDGPALLREAASRPASSRTSRTDRADRADRAEAGQGWGLSGPYRSLCRSWPRGTLPPEFYRVPVASVPVLLLSGALDPVTPPRHAQRVSQQLGELAVHRVLPASGHGQLGRGCVAELVREFLGAPGPAEAVAAARDPAQCARPIPRPPVFMPLEAAAAGVAR